MNYRENEVKNMNILDLFIMIVGGFGVLGSIISFSFIVLAMSLEDDKDAKKRIIKARIEYLIPCLILSVLPLFWH